MDDLADLLEQWEPARFIDWLEDDDPYTDQGAKRPVTKTQYDDVTAKDANPQGIVHGGEIVKRMDTLAGITARDYAEADVVTASIDTVAFHAPVEIGDTLYLESRIDYVGETSMTVHVDVSVEDYTAGERHRTTDAYFTFVAVDDSMDPVPVPDLQLETDAERERYESAKAVKDQLDAR